MSIPFEIANLATPRRSADSGPTKPEFDERAQRTANKPKSLATAWPKRISDAANIRDTIGRGLAEIGTLLAKYKIDFHFHVDLFPNPKALIDECERSGVYVLSVQPFRARGAGR
jgi:hypothetical protein